MYFLIPPSEWKNIHNYYPEEKLSFSFDKPLHISKNATQKDLKCSWKRYEEWILLNENIEKSATVEAINRYSGVMYNSIRYSQMNEKSRIFFQKKFLIFSGMYGLLSPLDRIGNYKLPIETKWLLQFWWDMIVQALNQLPGEYIVSFLPLSYLKMIDRKKILKTMIYIDFFNSDGKKVSHGVKKIKWEYIYKLCEYFWYHSIKAPEDLIAINWGELICTQGKDLEIKIYV